MSKLTQLKVIKATFLIPLIGIIFISCTNKSKPKQTTTSHASTKSDTIRTVIITDDKLKKLVDECNNLFAIYDTLSPFGNTKISSINLPKAAIDSIVNNYDSPGTGMVGNFGLIEYYQGEISEFFDKILNYNHIERYDLRQILRLPMVRSDDGRLYSISIDAKTGGSYRSSISWIQYRDANGHNYNFCQYENSDSTGFNSDGYNSITILKTKQGVKYLLQGEVMGCNTCIGDYINLVSFKNGKPSFDFSYDVSTRSGMDRMDGEVISYDEKRKRIEVNYLTNDMTPDCSCGTDEDFNPEKDLDEQTTADTSQVSNSEEASYGKRCRCVFVFDGNTFVLDFRLTKKANKSK